MAKPKLRESIAAEAARLMLRGKETEYMAARKRAARWLSRRKVQAEDLPTNAEIESQLLALSGLFADEHQKTALASMRLAAWELMTALEQFDPRLTGAAVDGPVMKGVEIVLRTVGGTTEEVAKALQDAGHRVRIVSDEEESPSGQPALSERRPFETAEQIRLTHRYPCVVVAGGSSTGEPEIDRTALEALMTPVEETPEPTEDEFAEEPSEDDYHPDTFRMLRMLLERLRSVRLDPVRHPEGDALYHSLQVYALGLQESPYDEEFLLACLLHDVGLGIDRRNSVTAALAALKGVLTERTCFLIEHRQEARDYLRTGKIARSLRRREHFDDLVLLARCDLAGRVPGTQVPTVDEALEYIEGLSTAWDDVD